MLLVLIAWVGAARAIFAGVGDSLTPSLGNALGALLFRVATPPKALDGETPKVDMGTSAARRGPSAAYPPPRSLRPTNPE
jgi:hypothetical protein